MVKENSDLSDGIFWILMLCKLLGWHVFWRCMAASIFQKIMVLTTPAMKPQNLYTVFSVDTYFSG